MLDELLVNQTTRGQIEAFVGRPVHALLISGPAGAGKKALARRLAAELLDVDAGKLDSYPYFSVIKKPDDKSEIPIDSTRQLTKNLTLKVAGADTAINRAALIEEADLLSQEAQNALLKVLEEPPAGTLLILTSSRPQTILPTVLSRAQAISVRPASLEDSQDYFKNGYGRADIESAWRLSRGAASLMKALLEQGNDHEMKQAVDEAKKALSLKSYERLNYIQSIAKDKARFDLFLDALSRVLSVLHQANAASTKLSKQILEARRLALQTKQNLDQNANTRLLALNLALNIPL